jgi:hypothetical protein
VPWCPTCERFLSPATVRGDGSCPSCGRAVDAGQAKAPTALEEAPDATHPNQEEKVPIPWHLKLLVAALVIYLGFRAWQGFELLL